MKTLRFTAIALLAISLGLSGCVEKEIPVEPTPEEVKSEITIDDDLIQNGLTFSRAEGEKSISFTTNEDWTLDITETSGREAWCNASAKSGMKGQANVKFSVSGNPSYDDRSASVTIKAGTVTKTFTITQSYAGAEGDDSGKVVVLKEAGTMRDLLGDNYLDITSLKIIGPLNGGDIYYLRRMLGGNNFRKDDWGKLTTLDLSESLIVEGGDWYYETSELDFTYYYTSYNTIGSYMFSGCANLSSIILPDTVTSIDRFAFQSCPSLQDVSIPSGLTSIGRRAFDDCPALEHIYITDLTAWCNISMEDVTSNPLYNQDVQLYLNDAKLIELVIPENITEIKRAAFAGSNFRKITIGKNVTSIGDEAFSDCWELESVVLPDGITSIGEATFSHCRSLQSIILPDSITSIGRFAFWRCEGLQSITLPNGITSIGEATFSECCSLESIILPDGVTSIGDAAFNSCSSLQSIILPDGITSIGHSAFWGCESLQSINLPDSITSIASGTFGDCWGLQSIILPVGIEIIEPWTFCRCYSLKTVTIGNNVASIGEGAFENCDELTDFYCHTAVPPTIACVDYVETFNSYGNGTTLYVPKGSMPQYQSSDWSTYFKNIKEMD